MTGKSKFMGKQAPRSVFLAYELQDHGLALNVTTLQEEDRRAESNRKERGWLDF